MRRNPLGRRSWAYTEALTSGYMMADEVHSSKFHASRGGVLVACPELDWFSDPEPPLDKIFQFPHPTRS